MAHASGDRQVATVEWGVTVMTATRDRRITGRLPRHLPRPFIPLESDAEHNSRAERWFAGAIDAWAREGRLTTTDAEMLRETVEEPQFVAVLPHFGVHLTIGAILRFPVGSIMRASYVFTNLLIATLRMLTRRIDRKAWRQAFGIHSPLVLLIAGMPGIGTFSYLASRPMRTNPLLLRVALDAALLKLPWQVYERTGLRWVIARPSAAAIEELQSAHRTLRLTIPAPAIVLILGAVACGLFVADIAAQSITELGIIEPDTMGWKHVARMLDLGAEASFGTWFQVIALVLLSVILATIAVARLRAHAPFAWHWFGLAILALGFSINEQVKIYDAGGGTAELRDALGMSGPLFYGWVLVAGVSVIVVGLVYRRFVLALPRATRRLFVLAAALYAGSEVGIEAISGWYASRAGSESDFVYQTISSFEELGGMAGIVVAIAAVLHYAQLHVGDIGITLHDGARMEATDEKRNDGRVAPELQAPSTV
jgi:hypothetical protein